MKRIISLLMLVMIIFGLFTYLPVSALSSPTTINYNVVNVEIKGTGGVTTDKWMIEANKGNTVTLKATEVNSPFVFWNLKGEYNIIEGMATDKEFTIEPLSDVLAVATFEDSVDEVAISENIDKNLNSLETGQETVPIYIAFIIIIIIVVCIYYCIKKIKYKRAYDKL